MNFFFTVFFLVFTGTNLFGQASSTLEKLIAQSNQNYGANKAAFFRTRAAEAQSTVVKDQFKPQLNAAYQLNYATYNNITGMVFPPFITPISGPPAVSNTYNGVFGSAAALLAKWDVATFGYQKSLLQQATAQASLSKAKELLQQFRQNVQLCSTYLDWLLASKLTTVYQNNIERLNIALELSRALTQKGLRPGTDSASLTAEYAKGRALLEQQQKETSTIFLQLQQIIGLDTAFVAADTVLLNKLPVVTQSSRTFQHPQLAVLEKEMENQKSDVVVIEQSKKPLLSLYGTGYARGSGVETNSDVKTFQGLYFQRYNYGAGAQLSVPLFEGARTRVKVQQQQQLVNAATEDYKLLQWQLQKELAEADTTLQRAINEAVITKSQQQSANFLFNAVSARYKAGLVSYAEVILAQQQLIEAEADIEKSKWEVWKAFLYKATVAGDLTLFTQQFK